MNVSVVTGGDLIARTRRWLNCKRNPVVKKKSAGTHRVKILEKDHEFFVVFIGSHTQSAKPPPPSSTHSEGR